MMERPIFILAQARSGSTLLQRVLNSVDNVLIYGEHVGVLSPIANSYVNFLKSQLGQLPADRDLVLEAQEALRRLKDPTDFSPRVNGFTRCHFQEAYRTFVRSLIHCIPAAQSWRWGFKEVGYRGPAAEAIFRMLRELFPGASFVFLVRHPLEQLASKDGTGWWTDSLEQKAITWREQTVSFLRCHESKEAPSLFLRYEDFIAPDGTAARELFQFLGLEYGARQHDIIFNQEKIGAATTKPNYPADVVEKLRTLCFTPETESVYRET